MGNKDYLFYDNKEILSTSDFNRLYKEEVNKEFPSIDNEEKILYRVKTVINLVNNNIELNNSEDKNDNDYYEDEDNDHSSEENVDDWDYNIGSNIFEF